MVTHRKPPRMFHPTNWRYGCRAVPATRGTYVRTIGTKRASTIARPPYFRKKSSVWVRYLVFRNRASSEKNRRPNLWPR